MKSVSQRLQPWVGHLGDSGFSRAHSISLFGMCLPHLFPAVILHEVLTDNLFLFCFNSPVPNAKQTSWEFLLLFVIINILLYAKSAFIVLLLSENSFSFPKNILNVPNFVLIFF